MTSDRPDIALRYSDAGPWRSGDAGFRQRIAYLVRRGCAELYGSINKAAVEFANAAGAPKRATLYQYAGSGSVPKPISEVTPDVSAIRFLLKSFDVSADWLFTGRGPRSRTAAAAGATMSFDALADELAAHLKSALDRDTRQRLASLFLAVDGAAAFTTMAGRVNVAAMSVIAREEAVRGIPDAKIRAHAARQLRATLPESPLIGPVKKLPSFIPIPAPFDAGVCAMLPKSEEESRLPAALHANRRRSL